MRDPNVSTKRFSRIRACLARRRAARDEGMALIAMVMLATVMSMIAAVIITDSTRELSRATIQVDKTSALQAAQAGIDDYLAKMTQDNLYYFHYVHPAEPNRTGSTGIVSIAPPDPPLPALRDDYEWLGTNPWTYTTPRRWVALGTDGYEYSIKITAPSATDIAVAIVSTGRKVNDPNMANWRAIQTRVRGSSVADFQVIVDDTSQPYRVGAGATTNGRVYSTGDICHDGIATADLLAEGRVNGGSSGCSVSLQSPGAGIPVAKIYDSLDTVALRAQIPVEIDFNTFTNALATLQAVAASTGLTLIDTNTNMKNWKLVFLSTGNIDIYKCNGATGVVNEASSTPPACTFFNNVPVPTIGAIYVNKSVLVQGIIKGRVTIASPIDIIISGNITYQTTGKDILGLVAKNDIIDPKFATDASGNLTWYSAAVAMEGSRQQGSGATGSGTLNYVGSIAMKQMGNGQSGLFATRYYDYDPTLQWLQPPFFPVISVNYEVLLFREITPVP
jgi:hypothetical protein